ncbi:MAG: hypothetical protein ACLPKT_25455 [Methylocella sp.]
MKFGGVADFGAPPPDERLKALAKFNALPHAFASPDWPDGHGDNPLYVQQRYGSNAYVPVSMINLNALGDPDWAAPEYRTKLQHVWLRGAYQAAESFEIEGDAPVEKEKDCSHG